MKPLIVANWKMNPNTLAEVREILSEVKAGIKDLKGVEIVICLPYIYLPYWPEFFRKNERKIRLGAQDCFWKEKGAYTGEISALMLKNLGCEYVILGHSERRKYFGETEEMINKKIKAALKVKLKPILCIGETVEAREQGKTFKILEEQLESAPKGILNSIIIAYEPVWAIGTGNPCGISEARKANLFIRKILSQSLNSLTPLLLYGGSVNSENAIFYIKEAGFSGLLVGGASIIPKEFIKIVKNLERA